MSDSKKSAATWGISLGDILAIIISWTTWHSVPWAVIHGFFGWIYVIYYFFKYGF